MFQVRTAAGHRLVAGVDPCIISVPDGVYVEVAGKRLLNVRALGAMLRQVSEDQARNIGETLHHAEWVITGDPQVVEQIGMHGNPNCLRCRGAVDQALAYLAEQPGRELLAGTLYWAGPAVGSDQ